MSIPTLRPYQLDAIAQVAEHMKQGHKRVLMVSPTGSGKTVIAAEVIRRLRSKGNRCLFLAHARQLVYQASEKLSAIGVSHGVLMAGERPRQSDVQVASLFTLKNKTLPPADLVVIDEADLARADTYAEILEFYKDAYVLGMTASPWRGDGKGLGELFSESVVVATPKELINLGFLVSYEGFVFEAMDTSGVGVNKRTGDYSEADLAKKAEGEAGKKIVGNIVEEYQRRAAGRRGVCFAVSVKHSQMLVEAFRAAGIPAEHVDANTKKEERAAMFARAARGDTKILCTVGILTRGVDIPALEVAILARATKSVSLYLQMVGRVMRPSPGTGKLKALILDHAGCIMRDGSIVHGLPDQERDYSLTSDVQAKAKLDDDEQQAPSIVQCRACYAIAEAGTEVCPICGASLVRPKPVVSLEFKGEARAVALEEVRARVVESDPAAEQEFLNKQVLLARERSYKPNAPFVRFKEKFGHWPLMHQQRRAARFADAEQARALGLVSA